LKEIVDAKGDGEAQKRVNNLAKRLLFDFCEPWKPDEASQFLEGSIVNRGRGIWQVGLHPLAAFASALDPRTKQLKAYSKEDCQKIWAGLHQKAMEHCQLPGGPLELDQQEVVNNTNQDEAVELQPPGLKASFFKHVLDRGQESEEGAGGDAEANIAKDIENEISKYKTWSALPFYDNAQVFSDPLLWKQK
jgi:hypothetical protein